MGGRRWSPRKVLSPGASCQPAHPSMGALFHVREVGKSKLLPWALLNMKPLLCCHLGLWASHHCLVANISPCLKVCCCFKWHLQTGKWHLHLLSLSWVWGVICSFCPPAGRLQSLMLQWTILSALMHSEGFFSRAIPRQCWSVALS